MTSTKTPAKPRSKAVVKTGTATRGKTTRARSNRKYDWDKIAQDYIEGSGPEEDRRFLNYRELAEAHGAPYQAVRNKASQERWNDSRATYQLTMAKTRQKERIKKLADQGVEFDSNTHQAATLGQRIIQQRLGEIIQEITAKEPIRKAAFEARQRGEPIEPKDLHSAIYPDAMMALGRALLHFQEAGHRALGMHRDSLEVTGRDGGPITVEQTVSVIQELQRDDPNRLSNILVTIDRSGIGERLRQSLYKEIEGGVPEVDDDEDVVDAEVIDD